MPTWKHLFYKAHNSFDDFGGLLWPERWSEASLRARRQEFIEDGDSAGYSQEFLNDPQDNAESYLRRDDFIPMTLEDFEANKILIAGADFAVSKADMANRTSFTVGGLDSRGLVHHLDFQVGRWSSTVTDEERDRGELGWVDRMFEIQVRWKPDLFCVEGGVIWKSVERIVRNRMISSGVYINLLVLDPVRDKASRGRAFQARHRAGATRWNIQAEGYAGAKEEMLRFTGYAAARLDDQFDSCATMHLGIERLGQVEDDDFTSEEEWAFRRADPRQTLGRNAVTGY
jgi:hypothetical protein